MENKEEKLAEEKVEQPPQKMKLNVYGLFKELEALIRDGFTEHEIRGAFEEFMEHCTGKYRPIMGRTARPVEAGPYPTNDEVNAIYVERVYGKKHKKKDGLESREELDSEALMNTLNELNYFANKHSDTNLDKTLKDLEAVLSPRKPSRVKILAYRVAYRVLKYPLKALIYIFSKFSRSRDEDVSIGFGMRHDD